MFDHETIDAADFETKSADAQASDPPAQNALAPNIDAQDDRAQDSRAQDSGTQADKPRSPRYRPRRSTSDRLRDAVLTLAKGAGTITSHEEAPWSSITFTGSRHEIVLDFEGSEAVEGGEALIEQLPDHEFAIPGQLVADASVREVDHRFGSEERMVVTCVLLLLKDV